MRPWKFMLFINSYFIYLSLIKSFFFFKNILFFFWRQRVSITGLGAPWSAMLTSRLLPCKTGQRGPLHRFTSILNFFFPYSQTF